MKAHVFYVVIASAVVVFPSVGVAHNVRMTPNLSPYLHLTRTEFQWNDSFPVYQKMVRPQLSQRSSNNLPSGFGGSSRPHLHQAPTVSPYLHLKRKAFDPFFPAFQAVVRPAIERQQSTVTRWPNPLDPQFPRAYHPPVPRKPKPVSPTNRRIERSSN